MPQRMRGEIYLSTDQVEPDLRNDFWRSVSQPLFHVSPVDGEEQMHGSILARLLGAMTVVVAGFNRQRQVRDRPIIASGGLDHYLLHFLISGTMRADCAHGSVEARAGDICLFDLSQPYVLHAEACELICLAIPREPIDRANPGRGIHGMLLGAGRPATAFIQRLLENLQVTAGAIAGDEANVIEEATLEYISSIVANLSGDTNLEIIRERNLRERVFKFIDDNLNEPSLGASVLMQRFQISRAHLYRAFAHDGGVIATIRDQRLDKAYQRLTRNADVHSVTKLAYELGFASATQFSRAFKHRFGLSPTAVKSGGRVETSPFNGLPLLHSHFHKIASCWNLQQVRVDRRSSIL